MHHHRRLLLPAALASALAATTATAQDGTGNAEAGLTAYESACGGCHSSAERLARRLGDDRADEATRLDEFLAGHHAPDETARRDVIAYLLSL